MSSSSNVESAEKSRSFLSTGIDLFHRQNEESELGDDGFQMMFYDSVHENVELERESQRFLECLDVRRLYKRGSMTQYFPKCYE
jgi:hypothetical protein